MTFSANNTVINKGSTDGMQVNPATDANGNPSKLAFFGGTPAAQQTPAGYTTMQTAGATTALYTNSATTGGVGTTQFTFGDVVAALKAHNLLKQ